MLARFASAALLTAAIATPASATQFVRVAGTLEGFSGFIKLYTNAFDVTFAIEDGIVFEDSPQGYYPASVTGTVGGIDISSGTSYASVATYQGDPSAFMMSLGSVSHVIDTISLNMTLYGQSPQPINNRPLASELFDPSVFVGGNVSYYFVDNTSINGIYNNVSVSRVEASGPTPFGFVPEPATWATMFLGFGLAGAALPRRRLIATA